MNSNQKAGWTPEPWTELFAPDRIEISKTDYNRAGKCVNALAGVKNPEEAVKNLVETLQSAEVELVLTDGDKRVLQTIRAALKPFEKNP